MVIGIVVCLCTYKISGQIAEAQLEEFKKVIPIETVVVHTNKTVFLAGETLFYKFYSLSEKNKPSDVSKFGYAILIGKNKNQLFEHKLKLEKGIASGDFFMPANVETGQYKLVAYTKWMENNTSQPFFETDIYVVNPFTVTSNSFSENIDTDKSKVYISKGLGFFNDGKAEFGKISLHAEQTSYQARSKAKVEVKNAFKEIYKGNYSLSIRKIDSLKIEEQEGVVKKELKTNGFYLPEIRSEIISGKLLSVKDNTPIPNKTITLTIPGRDYVFKNVKTNNEGAFYFNLYENYRDNEAVVQVQDLDRDQYKVVLDSKSFLYHDALSFSTVKLSDSLKTWLLNESVYKQIENAYANIKKDSVIYKEPNKAFYGEASITYVLDDFKRFPTVRETFIEVIQKAAIRESKDNYAFKVNSFLDFKNSVFKDYDPLVLVDGYMVQNNADIVEFDCDKIESVSVVRGIYFCGPMVYNGVLEFKTKNLDFKPLDHTASSLSFNLEAPQEQKVYYKPNYTINKDDLERIPDYRTQLLWIPNIEFNTDKNEIEFYTSDVIGSFEIVLEGYTFNGEYIKSRTVISVNN